jgi:glycerol uptake facilitator-like aquaporin
VANTTKHADPLLQQQYISLAFGFSLAVNAWVWFRVSGGLFNPAVSKTELLVSKTSSRSSGYAWAVACWSRASCTKHPRCRRSGVR